MKKENVLTPQELKIKAESLEELRQIKFELSQLNWDELNCIWNQAQNVAQLDELLDRAIAHFNYQEDETAEKLGHAFKYDTRNAGRFCYTYTNVQSEKYTERIEVYRPSVLTKFRELTQLIAYKHFGIEPDWRANEDEETGKRYEVLPLSACGLGVQLYCQ